MSNTETVTVLELGSLEPEKPSTSEKPSASTSQHDGSLENENESQLQRESAIPSQGLETATTSVEPVPPGKLTSAGILITLASVSLLNTFNSGMLVVALPTIASELDIPQALLLWPASVYSLGLSCFLLLMGAIADIVGNRPVMLTGSLIYTSFTLAVSLARTSDQAGRSR